MSTQEDLFDKILCSVVAGQCVETVETIDVKEWSSNELAETWCNLTLAVLRARNATIRKENLK